MDLRDFDRGSPQSSRTRSTSCFIPNECIVGVLFRPRNSGKERCFFHAHVYSFDLYPKSTTSQNSPASHVIYPHPDHPGHPGRHDSDDNWMESGVRIHRCHSLISQAAAMARIIVARASCLRAPHRGNLGKTRGIAPGDSAPSGFRQLQRAASSIRQGYNSWRASPRRSTPGSNP